MRDLLSYSWIFLTVFALIPIIFQKRRANINRITEQVISNELTKFEVEYGKVYGPTPLGIICTLLFSSAISSGLLICMYFSYGQIGSFMYALVVPFYFLLLYMAVYHSTRYVFHLEYFEVLPLIGNPKHFYYKRISKLSLVWSESEDGSKGWDLDVYTEELPTGYRLFKSEMPEANELLGFLRQRCPQAEFDAKED